MRSQTKSNRIKILVFIMLIALVLVGSIGATSVAAKSAIPGDALYSLKTTFEQTQLMLSKDAANRAQLKITFAEERLEEISKLVNEGRYLEIKQTVLDFESAINGALFELEAVTKSDPRQAAQLASAITASLSRYAEVLTGLAASVPEVVQAEVNRALESALLAGSLDMSSDDNNNNSNDDDDNMNSKGNDDMDDDNMNSNGNDDMEDDDNMNSNSNDDMDDDDNMNSNGNDDMDDDDNSNSNNDDDSNSNDDNDNEDDDSNSNDDNDNGDDNSNSNSNGDNDDNSNDDN